MAALHYTIRPADPAAHLFEVELDVDAPQSGMRFSLPVWIPGSYMIREFARNIVWLRAEADGKSVPIAKTDKHSWQLGKLPAGATGLKIRYAVYAWDLSVRCAHLDRSHGFFNGTQVFLAVEGREELPHRVRIEAPSDTALQDWIVATSLPEAGAPRHGFGEYEAASYDELIDHPVEMGRLTRFEFQVRGVPHEFFINGVHDCDTARLAADLEKACDAQCALFGDAPPPFARYVFLTTVIGEGHGGLEHRASTALLASRNDLPWRGMKKASDGYIGFLGLCSHEYLHSWNVKRIKPAAFKPYDLAQENYTKLLWLFEGFTSYYDDLALVRAGLISPDEYLKLVTNTVNVVRRAAGRKLQSLTESSFDAWIKYYRQDENSPNAIVSYYTKGALVALCLDLALREKSGGLRSLDDVMRHLWAQRGEGSAGVAEGEMPAIIRAATGIELGALVRALTEGCEELPLQKALHGVGVELAWEAESEAPVLGAKTAADGDQLRLVTVYPEGPAHRAGLSAGDTLIAFDGLKVRASGLDGLLARHAAGDALKVHAFRRDELIETELVLAEPEAIKAKLSLAPRASAQTRERRKAWLGQG